MSKTATAVVEAPPKKPARVKKPEIEIIDITDGRRVLECNMCPKLCVSRSCIVNGSGPKHAKYAIITDAPGETDDDRGRPMQGSTGETMRMWFAKVGIRADREVYFDNAVKCMPEPGKKVSSKEIANCRNHLYDALAEVEPDIIIAAGNGACEALLPKHIAEEGITKLRGHVFWHEELQCKVIPMFNPSSVFYDWTNEIFCLADLRKAVNEAKNPDKMADGLGKYHFILDVDKVEDLCDRLQDADLLVFDTETTHNAGIPCADVTDKTTLNTGLDWQTAQVLCVSMTDQVGTGYVVPLVGKNFRQIWNKDEYARVVIALRDLFASDVPKLGQNGKFDKHMLREAGINVNEYVYDTMIAHGFIYEGTSHALEPMRSMFTNMPFYDDMVFEASDGKKHMEWVDEEAMWTYAAADVDCTFRIAKELELLLDKEGDDPRWVYEHISLPTLQAVEHIEQNGVLIDMDLADKIIEECDELIAKTEREMYEQLPEKWQDFDYNSWQQKQKLLYVDLKLPLPPVLTKTGSNCYVCRDRSKQHYYHTSTNKDAIKELEDTHPVVKPLQTLTQLITLRKTFLLGEEGKQSGLLQNVAPDGRIHTAYNVGFVETGRLSSSPNLQNIPKPSDDRPELYKFIRKLFVAPEGKSLVEVDYSQLELRILAYMSGEELMIEKFERDDDFHTFVARNILFPKVDPDMDEATWKSVHKELRDRTKVFNFGVPYGLTAWGMSQRFHVPEEEAVGMINDYMAFLSKVRDYFRKSDNDLKRRGKRLNAFGRIRHFWGVNTMTHWPGYRRALGHMKREAYNYVIQSTGADILSLAMIGIDNDPWFLQNDCLMVLTVHDSITMEAPDEVAVECAHRVQQHFARAGKEYLNWYTPGEATIGKRWSTWSYAVEVDGKVETIKDKKTNEPVDDYLALAA